MKNNNKMVAGESLGTPAEALSGNFVNKTYKEIIITSQTLEPISCHLSLSTRGFLMFSRGKERDQWHEMG